MKNLNTLILSCFIAMTPIIGAYVYQTDAKKEQATAKEEIVSADPFIAEVILFAGNFAPRGWAFCNGQILSIAQNTALFSLLGTTYGGDGQTTFALPDLRGRVPLGPGQGPGLSNRTLGESSGQETHTLIVTEMPAHNHTGTVSIPVSTTTAEESSPNGKYLANSSSPIYNEDPSAGQFAGAGNATINNTGGSQPHNNMQPWLGLHYIIALEGIYPSRN